MRTMRVGRWGPCGPLLLGVVLAAIVPGSLTGQVANALEGDSWSERATVDAVAWPAAGNAPVVVVLVKLPAAPFLAVADTGELVLDVTIDAFAVGRGSGADASVLEAREVATVDLARHGAPLRAGVLTLRLGDLRLAPGDHRVDVAVVDRATGNQVTGQATVTVPAPDTALVPAFPKAVAPESLLPTDAASRRQSLDIAGTPFVPTLRAVVGGEQPVSILIAGRGLARREHEIGSEVLRVDGSIVLGARLLISSVRSGAPDALGQVLGLLHLPRMAPGDYRLRLGMIGEDGKLLSPTTLPFAVTPSAPDTLLAFRSSTAPDAEAERAVADDGSGLPLDEIKARYRTLLARLGEVPRDEIVRSVARFEAEAVGGQAEHRIPRLRRGQLAVLERLARQDVETLVPALLLHHDVCRAHKRDRRTYLMHHAITVVRTIADRYASRADSVAARLVSAQALASLGGHLQAAGQRSSLALFHEALRHVPNHAASLLGLAAFREKLGGPYDDVIGHLGRLVKAHPDDREARLRLAVNQLRFARQGPGLEAGRLRKQARGHLATLVESPINDWVFVLAAQELARTLSRRDGLSDAIGVLERASARMPEMQKLRLQLAFLYDRAQRPEAAQALLAEMRGQPMTADPARGRYNRWPRRALEVDREALVAGAQRRTARLMQLAGTPAGGGWR